MQSLAPFVALAVLSACSSSTDSGGSSVPSTVILFKPGDGAAPAYGDVPFPSDLYRDASGRVSASIQGFERVAALHTEVFQAAFGTMDGFGRATAAAFFTDGAIDPDSLAGNVLLVDVDAASPDRGKAYPASARYLASLRCISVLPRTGVVLAPGVRYAMVVTTGVRDAEGHALGADTALRSLEGLAGAARKSAAEQLYGDALDALVESGAIDNSGEVAGLAVYTTTRMVFEIGKLRDRLRSSEFAAPQLLLDAASVAPYSLAIFGVATTPDLDTWMGTPEKDENGKEWPGVDNPGGPAHDQMGVVASGAFASPSFLDASTLHMEHAGDGTVIVANAAATVPVTIMIPKAPPATSAGYPVIIYGHGLEADRSGMFAFANEYARAGFAVVAIDDVGHGLRTGIFDKKNNFKGTYAGPDGLPDNPGLPLGFFGGFTDFVTIRDNFRQTVLDDCNLVRMIENAGLDLSPLAAALGGTTPKLDGKHIYWAGQSLGGMMGSIFTAVEPDLRASAVDVPGGAFVQYIATNSTQLHAVVSTLSTATFGIAGDDVLDEYHPGVQLMAMTTEPGDPIDYAPHVFGQSLYDPPPARRPSLLLSYSVDDEVMPNRSTNALIGAYGIPILTPSIRDVEGIDSAPAPISGNFAGRTGAAVQYSPGTHGLGSNRYDWRQYLPGDPQPDPANRWAKIKSRIQIELPIRQHIAAIVHFFSTDLADQPAEAIVTAPPADDYDGDGVLDATETANGTDPYDPSSR